jgi:hypothetical protein
VGASHFVFLIVHLLYSDSIHFHRSDACDRPRRIYQPQTLCSYALVIVVPGLHNENQLLQDVCTCTPLPNVRVSGITSSSVRLEKTRHSSTVSMPPLPLSGDT